MSGFGEKVAYEEGSGEVGLSDRVEKLDQIDNAIDQQRPDETPDGDVPGPHARLLDAEPLDLDEENSNPDRLAFKAIHQDGYFTALIVDWPVPKPGPTLKAIYEYFGLDPYQANPSDLFKKDIPIRPVEDVSGDTWILDLPPREGGVLYHIRRYLVEVGVMSWRGADLEIGYDRDEADDEMVELEENLREFDHIGLILPNTPKVNSKVMIVHLIAWGLVLGSFVWNTPRIQISAFLFSIGLLIFTYIIETRTVRRE